MTRREVLNTAIATSLGFTAGVALSENKHELKPALEMFRDGMSAREMAKSYWARIKGGSVIAPGESLFAFPQSVVTGDVSLWPLPIAMNSIYSPEHSAKLGQVLAVKHPVRLMAPFGAYVEYNPGDTDFADFVIAKMRRMTEHDNCEDGCDKVALWAYEKVGERSYSMSVQGIYTKDELRSPIFPAKTELY